jgi:gamma-glutamyltranspeptidase/glutathione hydrolase
MPDRIQFEPLGINRDTRSGLEKKGHVFAEKPGNMGDAEGIMIDPKSGLRLGASDPRSGGAPVGY